MFLGFPDLSSMSRRAKRRIFRSRNMLKQRFRTQNSLRLVLVIVTACFCLVGLTFCPPLSWRLKEEGSSMAVEVSCPSCSCDCSLVKPISFPIDCNKTDPEMYKETKKDVKSLLYEEIGLHEEVTNDTLEYKKSQVLDVKGAYSRYQNEAEKCHLGTVVCETARERAEAELVVERRASALWERRAKALGWKDSRRVYTR